MNAEIATVRHSFENIRTIKIFVPIEIFDRIMIAKVEGMRGVIMKHLSSKISDVVNSVPILSNSESESDDDRRRTIRFKDEEISLLTKWFREKNGEIPIKREFRI
uniref:F-ATPase epsilon subunit n=1 Tax=Strongyloides papillosus TaxID=174720 RepID=A0A0N5BLY4_STREA